MDRGVPAGSMPLAFRPFMGTDKVSQRLFKERHFSGVPRVLGAHWESQTVVLESLGISE